MTTTTQQAKSRIINALGDLYRLQRHSDGLSPEQERTVSDAIAALEAGGDPVAVAEEFMDRVGYFHLKDTTPEEWREIGYGAVDFGDLIKLIESRYEGWLVVEQDETRRQPVESARMSRDYLKEQFGL